MRHIVEKFICAVCLVGLASCASAGTTYTWQDIKKEVGPSGSTPVSDSYLRVYTRSDEINDGGYLWVRGPRYAIYSDKGKKIRSVTNDNTPNTFTLSPGRYVIVPLEGQYKNEVVGAVLEPGKLTEVHMMGG